MQAACQLFRSFHVAEIIQISENAYWRTGQPFIFKDKDPIIQDMKKRVVIGMLGATLDRAGSGSKRWQAWRPSVALCQHEDFLVERFDLLYQKRFSNLLEQVMADIRTVSPETEIVAHEIPMMDAWDFEEVYAALLDFAQGYNFDSAREDYLLHITTGTHVAQICMFLLAEARYLPARLLQTSPPTSSSTPFGELRIIDLDLSRYDKIATRFERRGAEARSFLKSGIETRNPRFNQMIEEIELIAVSSREPILLSGPTGAGKSQLARNIFNLKKDRHLLTGSFVEVNCATLRGDASMSTLFGHRKGAFTGAVQAREGLLMSADRGLLFLDEIGELGLDEQAMLLKALEQKAFFPVGSDVEVSSDFQLIAGTNRNLQKGMVEGRFREDLYARINLWSYEIPGLRDRIEDFEPNLEFELEKFARKNNKIVAFNKEGRERFIEFARNPEARWTANFRDLNSAITRMATLAGNGRITLEIVDREIGTLSRRWGNGDQPPDDVRLPALKEEIDLFDKAQLREVVRVCRQSSSLSEAGRKLFAVSRQQKTSPNDADRLRKYLARFGLTWAEVSRN
jgi:transcriptional regulatory protein RtcR